MPLATDQMIATNMGRTLYSSEAQQPEFTTLALCGCGHAEHSGKVAAVLSRADVLHLDGRAAFVPERAENCGHEQSLTGTGNIL